MLCYVITKLRTLETARIRSTVLDFYSADDVSSTKKVLLAPVSYVQIDIRWPTSDNLHPNQLAPHPYHNHTTPTPHQHHNRLKLVWCGRGVGVVRAGLGEGCHLWATYRQAAFTLSWEAEYWSHGSRNGWCYEYKCKKTVVYTRVNGALHIENCKNYKKVITHQHIA